MSEQAKILQAIAENLDLSVGDLDRHAFLQEDLNLGPVELGDLLDHLSGEFQVHFDSDDVNNLETVDDLVILVEDSSI